MHILLLGYLGQLGHELRTPLSMFAQLSVTDLPELDLTDLDAVRAKLVDLAPDLVVNASAFTDVDGAERDPAKATRINAEVVGLVGEHCRAHKAGLLHVSTDFVFDGRGTRPYQEDDLPNPLGAYGRSKLEGELVLRQLDAPAVVLRTAWVYSLRRKSFVTSILRLAREREELRVVDDQIGNPTFCRDLAQAMALLAHEARRGPYEAMRELRGVYHLASPDSTNRHEFARAILELDPGRAQQRVRSIVPVRSSAFPLPAERPLHAPLDCSKAERVLGLRLPLWRESLERAFSPRLVPGS
jgi:dTDP-4-dehydrorhamnose reductase